MLEVLIKNPIPWSTWFRLEDRRQFSDGDRSGVYSIAVSEQCLIGQAHSYEIVTYIGMSRAGRGLWNRWQHLSNAVMYGKKDHTAGRKLYAENGAYKDWSSRLYISAFPMKFVTGKSSPEALLRTGQVCFTEYKALAEFMVARPLQGKPSLNGH